MNFNFLKLIVLSSFFHWVHCLRILIVFLLNWLSIQCCLHRPLLRLHPLIINHGELSNSLRIISMYRLSESSEQTHLFWYSSVYFITQPLQFLISSYIASKSKEFSSLQNIIWAFLFVSSANIKCFPREIILKFVLYYSLFFYPHLTKFVSVYLEKFDSFFCLQNILVWQDYILTNQIIKDTVN